MAEELTQERLCVDSAVKDFIFTKMYGIQRFPIIAHSQNNLCFTATHCVPIIRTLISGWHVT